MTSRALGLAIVGLGASLGPLDIAVNVALPAITAHFRLALSDVQWLVICYVLVYGSLMLVCGKLGDLFGHRLIFRIGLVISAIGCAACAAAPDWPLFLWARASQGVGTALAISCTPALATSLFPDNAADARDRRSRRGDVAGCRHRTVPGRRAGRTVGLARCLLDARAPRPDHACPVRPAAVAQAGRAPVRCGGRGDAGRLHECVLAVADPVATARSAGPLGGRIAGDGACRRWAYVRRARRVPEPIIRPALFADPAFTVPNVMNVLASLAGFSILLLTPYYLVNVLQLSALMSGLVLALAFAGSLTGAPLSAFFVRRIGQRPTAFAGVSLVGLGLLPLAFTGASTPVAVVALLLILEGVGQGLLAVAYTDLVAATLPPRDRGVAGSLALLTRTLGNVSGASVLTTLHAVGAAGLSGLDGFLAGYRFAFIAVGGGLLAALALSLLVPRAWSRRI